VDRAETHLLLVAEAELRRATDPDAPGAARVMAVARALTAVGAIDAATAARIQADFELALTVRPSEPGPAVRRRRWPHALPARPMAASVQTGASGQLAAPVRLVPAGVTIPLASPHSQGELHLLTYAQTAAGGWFTAMAGVRSAPEPTAPVSSRPDLPGMELLNQLTATDEAGNGYTLTFRGGASGGSGGAEWSGQLRLRPDPPPGLRWLNLATGPAGPATLIGVDPPPAPEVTLTPTTLPPGEHLLHGLAARLLAGRRTGAAPGRIGHGPDELGAVVEALQVVGALPPLSPVPGQLAALCARLNLPGHGITAAPARDLPERWLSALGPERSSPRLTPGCAGAAVALPELDGIQLLILGLHSGQSGAVLHAHASGPGAEMEPDGSGLPVLWLRDDRGRWHTTTPLGAGLRDGEVTVRLLIVPPLHRSAWIEVVAAGTSAEARTTLALRWSRAGG
jgi:hypothetical protein